MMSDLSRCPWCGAAAEWYDETKGRSGYACWQCGAYKAGDVPTQTDSCIIYEQANEVESLRQQLADAKSANVALADWIKNARETWLACHDPLEPRREVE
jgi:phage/plasmid primase-like uncharacterized protein